jgi:outer membrane beta-barrel protein
MYGIAMGVIGALALSSTMASARSAAPKRAKSVPAPQAAPATAAESAGASAKGADDKVDISDLENKYWAPKDTDFSVVQNRTYTKEHRWFLTGQWGRPVNDQWNEGNVFGATGNYFFSERYGMQLMYTKGDLHNSQAVEDVAHYGSGIQPDHGRFNSYYGVGFNVVPFYAKMSFWGRRIIYFDMAFTPTVGMTQYDQIMETHKTGKSAFTYGIDITQFFFFTNWFALRADLKNQWHTEEIVHYRGNGSNYSEGEKVRDKGIQDTMFLLGVTFFY